jgi:hypothetical protein
MAGDPHGDVVAVLNLGDRPAAVPLEGLARASVLFATSDGESVVPDLAAGTLPLPPVCGAILSFASPA